MSSTGIFTKIFRIIGIFLLSFIVAVNTLIEVTGFFTDYKFFIRWSCVIFMILFLLFLLPKKLNKKHEISRERYMNYLSLLALLVLAEISVFNILNTHIFISIGKYCFFSKDMMLLLFTVPISIYIIKFSNLLIFEKDREIEHQAEIGKISHAQVYDHISMLDIFKKSFFSYIINALPASIIGISLMKLFPKLSNTDLHSNGWIIFLMALFSFMISHRFFKNKTSSPVVISQILCVFLFSHNLDLSSITRPGLYLPYLIMGFFISLFIFIVFYTVSFIQLSMCLIVDRKRAFLKDRKKEFIQSLNNLDSESLGIHFSNLLKYNDSYNEFLTSVMPKAKREEQIKTSFDSHLDHFLKEFHHFCNGDHLRNRSDKALKKKIRKLKNQLNTIKIIKKETQLMYKPIVGIILAIISMTGAFSLFNDIQMFYPLDTVAILRFITSLISVIVISYCYFASMTFTVYTELCNLESLVYTIDLGLNAVLIELEDSQENGNYNFDMKED